MDRIKIPRIWDGHGHLREDPFLEMLSQIAATQCSAMVVMPNTRRPVITCADLAIGYRGQILRYTSGSNFRPYVTIKLVRGTTTAIIEEARKYGVIAVKLYPIGVTTNAEDGIIPSELPRFYPVFDKMQSVGLPLLHHGQLPGVFGPDREKRYLDVFCDLSDRFPELPMTMEHITTVSSAMVIKQLRRLGRRVAATITAHHLVLTQDDVIGPKVRPHNFCLPTAQRPEDRFVLCEMATSGYEGFYFGSDTAPWPKSGESDCKECREGCAGCFTGPLLAQLLVTIFESLGALDKLPNFIAGFGPDFYGVPREPGELEMVREDWTVPMDYGGMEPFMAGQMLPWRIVEQREA